MNVKTSTFNKHLHTILQFFLFLYIIVMLFQTTLYYELPLTDPYTPMEEHELFNRKNDLSYILNSRKDKPIGITDR